MEKFAHHSTAELKIDMMGLQATATKRKYDQTGLEGEESQKTENTYNGNGETQSNASPAKTGRWSTMQLESTNTSSSANTTSVTTTTNSVIPIPSAEESIAKLEAVAMALPSMVMPLNSNTINGNGVESHAGDGSSIWRDTDSTRSALATTLLSADDLEDSDDDFEDDFEEDNSFIPCYAPLSRYPCTTNMAQRGYMSGGAAYPKPNYYPKPSYCGSQCASTQCGSGNCNNPVTGNSCLVHKFCGSQCGSGNCTTPMTSNSMVVNRSLPMNHHSYGWPQHNPHHPIYYGASMEMGNEQQTIRCAENGKSYLELGSANYMNNDSRHLKRCCDGRNGMWCNNNKQCYRERRLKMRNLSMFKLSRFRQISEQSLYRSVLICNTLKCIDREIEQENKDAASHQADFHQAQNHYTHIRLGNINNNNNSCGDMRLQQMQHHQSLSPIVNGNRAPNWSNSVESNSNLTATSVQQQQQQNNLNILQQQQRSQSHSQTQHMQSQQAQYSSSDNNSNSNNYLQPYTNRTPTPITSAIMTFNETLPPYDHHPLRDCNGRATPFPGTSLPDTDSGYGEEEKPINWSSVLSLSSQSALDPLNNNDLFSSTPVATTVSITSSNSTSNTSLSSQSSSITTTSQFTTLTPVTPSIATQPSAWEYNFDLGSELTELLPMEPSKMVENEMDSLTALMVGGS